MAPDQLRCEVEGCDQLGVLRPQGAGARPRRLCTRHRGRPLMDVFAEAGLLTPPPGATPALAPDPTAGLTQLGRRVTTFEGFETFPAPEGCDRVVLRSSEVTALCPVTGQPDWYDITVAYTPRGGRCVESKTVKLYFQSFREQGLFCEALAGRIAHDFAAALGTDQVLVTVVQTARGGVALTATGRPRPQPPALIAEPAPTPTQEGEPAHGA